VNLTETEKGDYNNIVRAFYTGFPRNFPVFFLLKHLTLYVQMFYNILRGMLRSGWFSAWKQKTLWHLWDVTRCSSAVEIGGTAKFI